MFLFLFTVCSPFLIVGPAFLRHDALLSLFQSCINDISCFSVAARTRTQRMQKRVLRLASMGSKQVASRRRISGRRNAQKARGRWYQDFTHLIGWTRHYPWNPTTCGCCTPSPLIWNQGSTYYVDTAVQAINSLSTLFGHLQSGIFGLYTLGSLCQEWHSSNVISTAILHSLTIHSRFRSTLWLWWFVVTYRLIRFYGNLGASLKCLKKLDRIPAVMAQLEQCLVFAKRKFGALEL